LRAANKPEMNFARRVQGGHLMKVFWSWQSDRDPKLHRYFVRDALKAVCKLIASDPDCEEADRPEVDHDTKNVPGSPDITTTILAKIASASVFIADVTPIGRTDPAALQPNAEKGKRPKPKYLQNPNVMSELGYAERALTQDRIILVANRKHYPGEEALPFDWRHRSGPKLFHLADDATREEIAAEQKRFATVLKNSIQPILLAKTPAAARSPAIVWQESSVNDAAIWKGADQVLQYRNEALEEPTRRVRLAEGKRIYARLAPSEWTLPLRNDLGHRISKVGLVIRSTDGDWGVNGDGALSVWGRIGADREKMEVWNATQWFRETGEIWAVNTNTFTEHKGRLWFSTAIPFAPLDDFLLKGIAAIREMGGRGPIGVKLGAIDIVGTVLPVEDGRQFVDAVASEVKIAREAEDWTLEERRALLLDFWNELMDAYGHRPMTMAEFLHAARLQPTD
jgi:hypothetical protein